MVIGAEAPGLKGMRDPPGETQDRRPDLRRQAMVMRTKCWNSFGKESGSNVDRTSWQEAPEEPFFLLRKRFSSEDKRRNRGSVQEGPRKVENPSSDWDHDRKRRLSW